MQVKALPDSLYAGALSEPGCSAKGCRRAGTNRYRGRDYCGPHARIIRDQVFSRLDESSSDEVRKALYVYAIRAPALGLCKIGKSRNPKQRHLTLLHQSPVELDLLGYVIDPTDGRLEAWLHAYLQGSQARGEWFKETDDTRMVVDMIVGNRVLDLMAFGKDS